MTTTSHSQQIDTAVSTASNQQVNLYDSDGDCEMTKEQYSDDADQQDDYQANINELQNEQLATDLGAVTLTVPSAEAISSAQIG